MFFPDFASDEVACEVDPCREWVVGNVAEENAMSIWRSQPYQNFRKLLAEQGTIPICSRCCYMTHG